MFKHEIFITKEAVHLINNKEGLDKSKKDILNEASKYCDRISSGLNLTTGMSVMIVVRKDQKGESNVWFVYNQCLDTAAPANPNGKFIKHNPSLNIDTHIFKPTGGRGGMTKHPANKYHSWFTKRTVKTIFEGKSKMPLWE